MRFEMRLNKTWSFFAPLGHRVTYALRARRRGRVREEARVAVEADGGELWVERTEGDVRDLWCHGMRYVRHARGWYAYGVRAVRTSGQAALRLRYVQHAAGWYA